MCRGGHYLLHIRARKSLRRGLLPTTLSTTSDMSYMISHQSRTADMRYGVDPIKAFYYANGAIRTYYYYYRYCTTKTETEKYLVLLYEVLVLVMNYGPLFKLIHD